ncbi:MAG: DNA ligase [Candidatus Krumholzibacteriota bacterium]|nr:DNA ligase [Candidatus Krumholzibacteriota bacterium]
MAAKRPLDDYRGKRDFNRTPEPADEAGGNTAGGFRFVVQKHDARNLHYDFRIEIDGVLASWAVPKGPSLSTRERRLAVPTEDHPLSYAEFEGIIPEGEYGGGTVMVWDTGTYRNLRAEKEEGGATMAASREEGMIEIFLEGRKLRGGFALIRTGAGPKTRWLLVKKRDGFESDRDILADEPRSALTGRLLAEIAAGEPETP